MKISIQEAKFHEKYEKELQEIREKVFRNYENVASTSDKLDSVIDRMSRISDKAEAEIRRLVVFISFLVERQTQNQTTQPRRLRGTELRDGHLGFPDVECVPTRDHQHGEGEVSPRPRCGRYRRRTQPGSLGVTR